MEIWRNLFTGFLYAGLFGLPAALTGFHVVLLCLKEYGSMLRRWRNALEVITVFLGSLYTFGYLLVESVELTADWPVQLSNDQVHTPVATFGRPTIAVLACMGIVGYLILRLIPLRYMPPLVVVLGISFVYAGILVNILWCIQVSKGEYSLLALFPINCIMMALIQIKDLMRQWNSMQREEPKTYSHPFLQTCSRLLDHAALWPVAALVLFLPVFGAVIGTLVLLGQRPDDVITAFTQTSEWNLSQKVSPQNIYYDEHYLCTVAAGGHKKIVKPQRLGVRHGHKVIVNRQLCIANAFEQILEERVPRIHRRIRRFYDTYGFPIARGIRSPYTADLVYVLMKPLEWMFLAVIYVCDVKPENRIAVMYLPPVTIESKTLGDKRAGC